MLAYIAVDNLAVHFFLKCPFRNAIFPPPVSPVEGTETGLTGGEEKDKIQNGGLK